MTEIDTTEIRLRCVGRGDFALAISVTDALALCDALDAARAAFDFTADGTQHYKERAHKAEADRDEWRAIAEHRLAMYRVAVSHACRSAAQVAAVRALAGDMETWCSPYGVAVTYAQRIRDALSENVAVSPPGKQGATGNGAGNLAPQAADWSQTRRDLGYIECPHHDGGDWHRPPVCPAICAPIPTRLRRETP